MPEEITTDEFNPSWMQDGYGISGEQPDYVEEDLQQWDINAWSDNTQTVEDFTGTGGSGGITVTVEDASGYTGGGVLTLSGRDVLTFDSNLFELYDGGGGQAVIKLRTCDASCGAT